MTVQSSFPSPRAHRPNHPLPAAPNLQVVAVSSHSARVENELRAAGGREQALARELEGAKRAAAALERSPSAKARAAGGWVGAGWVWSVRVVAV